MKRGIYLVANLKSQTLCENLIFSIRESGCRLPIRIIHFGGEKVNSGYILQEAEFLTPEDFSQEGRDFVNELSKVLTACPIGYLYRFLGWFSDWEEFIYSDNDIVATTNWEELFDYLPGNDIVHADEEYTTEGKYNYNNPEALKGAFGNDALLSAITAGHYVAHYREGMLHDMRMAMQWIKDNPGVAKLHDQAFMHIAALIGNWKLVNLCKAPHNWLSSWSGDYKNSLSLIQAVNNIDRRKISHLHYSGGTPTGLKPIEDLLYSNRTDEERYEQITKLGVFKMTGITSFKNFKNKVKRKLK